VMVELLKHVISMLVDEVDAVRISEIKGDAVLVLEVKVDKKDVGKVIGKQGKTADALRTIVSCAAAKMNKRYILQIVDGSEL
jgi:predicted RNA-binding protein YlqC (UPF0109 family)